MTATEYIHLYPAGSDMCDMERSVYESARNTWLCTGCLTPKPGTGAIDAEIVEAIPVGGSITFINGCFLIIARKDILRIFDPQTVSADLMLGSVTGAGIVLTDWVTVRGRERINIRGSKHIGHRFCELCGRSVYFALGHKYLFPTPPPSASIYETNMLGLLAAVQHVDTVQLSRLRGLNIKSLKVRKAPADGLGELI